MLKTITAGAISAAFSFAAASATTFVIEQEATPGAGDWQLRGYADSFDMTGLTASQAYSFGSPAAHSYNGGTNGLPAALSGQAMLMMVETGDGMSLFMVLDEVKDGSGGTASTFWSLSGDADGAGFLVRDDNPGNDSYGSYGQFDFSADHRWNSCCTDGYVIGALDQGFTLVGGFEAFSGLSSLVFMGEDGNTGLDLVANRRVRIAETPLPAALPMGAAGFAGLMALARRRRSAR